MRFQHHLALLSLLFIGGCSGMTVNVSILDARFRNSPAFLEVRATRDAQTARDILAGYSLAKLQSTISIAVGQGVDAINNLQTEPGVKPTVMSEDARQALIADITADVVAQVDDKCQPVLARLRQASEDEDKAAQLKLGEKRSEAFVTAASELTTALDAWHSVKGSIPRAIAPSMEKLSNFMDKTSSPNGSPSSRAAGAAPPAATAAATVPATNNQANAAAHPSKAAATPVNAVQMATAIASNQVTGAVAEALPSLSSNDVFNDPYASIVINAPSNYWEGVYNRTFGVGTLGDTDIAVRMESVGDFTIKGVRDDASKITSASFQGVQQAVKLAAAIYGVPLPTPSSSGTGASASTGATGAGAAGGANPATITNPAGSGAASVANPSPPSSADQKSAIDSKVAALTILSAITTHRADFAPAASSDMVKAGITAVQSAYTSGKSSLEGD
jgi:hypothetical protein